jgi:hypothetical protein
MRHPVLRLALGALSIVTLMRSAPVSADETPAPAAGFARVTLLSEAKGKQTVYLDRAAVAVLTGPRTYATLQVEAGPHLLWGASGSDPEWLTFEAGRTYGLVLMQTNPNATAWCLDDTMHVKVSIIQEKAGETIANAAALAEMTAAIKPEKYDKLRSRAGEPVATQLPADFDVNYRKGGGVMRAVFHVDVSKKAHVDAEGISIKGGPTIPAAEIKMLQLYGADGGMPWIAVGMHDPQNMELAFLGIQNHYNALFTAIALARAAARAQPDSAGGGR